MSLIALDASKRSTYNNLSYPVLCAEQEAEVSFAELEKNYMILRGEINSHYGGQAKCGPH